MKISFDTANNPQSPTIILAKQNGEKLDGIRAIGISIKDCLVDASEISFEVKKYRYVNGIKEKDELWDYIKDFKLAWCKEWDIWFKLKVDITESNETTKTVYGTRLGIAELSQIMLYNIEINTEDDISRSDYEPSVLYQPFKSNASILNRIMEKSPHYTIIHVDSTIANIQRTFKFDNISIYDSLQEIAKEIGCLFVFHSNSDENGYIQRTISVYDLQSNCKHCGYRGEFTSICPECNSKDIYEGYGEDTTIFITADELGNEIQFTSDTGSIKNCFKLEGGDDLMTATIRNCNPNGTDYLWYITDEMKEDMSKELVYKLNSYDKHYRYYQNEYVSNLNEDCLLKYNSLVEKYNQFDSTINKISPSITGYPELMKSYYNVIDFEIYLKNSLMPDAKLSSTSAKEQSKLLTVSNLSPVAVTSLKIVSAATADNAVLGMAKAIIDTRYQIKINTSSFSNNVWQGNFIVTNYSDEEDTIISNIVSITITDNYEKYVKQKIEKALSKDKSTDSNADISSLFELNQSGFTNEIKKYGLSSLTRFIDSCQSCIDILIEQGISDAKTWSGQNPNLYNDLYLDYYNKLHLLQDEAGLRQKEIDIISGIYDIEENLINYGLKNYIEDITKDIQKNLDFKSYLGNDLWLEFCIFRREDKYSNSNYISDGLDNAELFDRALEFIQTAKNEIYKSAELQHSISTTLKNLLMNKKFSELVRYFEVGNWIRIRIDDKVYKLRLIEYEIDFNNIEVINVDFSDVITTVNGMNDTRSILEQAKDMASSYDYVQHQASQGSDSNKILHNMADKGLSATNIKILSDVEREVQTWDKHGLLFREYDEISDTYSDEAIKVVHSTLAYTNDNWKTSKAAIGRFIYLDPKDCKYKTGYGVIADTIVGNIILGEEVGIYNSSGNLTFDNNGFSISNGINTFKVNPNSKSLLSLSHDDIRMLYVDENGALHIDGSDEVLDLSSNNTIKNMQTQIKQNSKAIELKATKDEFGTYIKQNWKEVIIGFNTNSQFVQIDADTGAAISIYDGSITGNKLLSRFDSGGNSFYRDGTYVGNIGTSNHDTRKGLTFRIENDSIAGFMGFIAENSTGDGYNNVFTYDKGNGTGVAFPYEGLWCGKDFFLNGLNFYFGANKNTYLKSYDNGFGLITNNGIFFENSNYINENGRNTMININSKGMYLHNNVDFAVRSGGTLYVDPGATLYVSSNSIFKVYRNTTIDFYSQLNMYSNIAFWNGATCGSSSDEILKKNIEQPSFQALDKILDVDIFQYDWRTNEEHVEMGVIAQQVKDVIPESVFKSDNGLYAVSMEKFIPYIIKAIQELNEKIISNNMDKSVLEINNITTNSTINKNVKNRYIPKEYTEEEIKRAISLVMPKYSVVENHDVIEPIPTDKDDNNVIIDFSGKDKENGKANNVS